MNLSLQTVSGRLRQATFVLLHLIGVAAEFVGLPIGLRRSIGGVGKVRKLYGVLRSNKCFENLPNSGRSQNRVKEAGVQIFFCSFIRV